MSHEIISRRGYILLCISVKSRPALVQTLELSSFHAFSTSSLDQPILNILGISLTSQVRVLLSYKPCIFYNLCKAN